MGDRAPQGLQRLRSTGLLRPVGADLQRGSAVVGDHHGFTAGLDFAEQGKGVRLSLGNLPRGIRRCQWSDHGHQTLVIGSGIVQTASL